MPLGAKWTEIILRAALGGVLLVSSAYKLKDRRAFEMAVFVALGNLRKLYKPVSWIGLAVELAIGLALCAGFYPTFTACACLALFLIFDAALISLRVSGYEGGCGCFGSKSSGGVTMWHFARNAALSIAAGWLMFLRIR